MSEKDRMDFSALDPSREPDRLERSAREIARRAAPALRARRERRPDLWTELTAWQRPLLAVAALLALALVTALALVRPAQAPLGSSAASVSTSTTSTTRPSTLMEAAGLPKAMATWAETGQLPRSTDILELGGA